MTGDLTVDNASAVVKDGRVESGTTPGSNIYGRAFYLFDKNGVNVGTFQIMSLANGREGFQLVANKKVGNTNKNNYLRMNVDSNGDPVIDLSSPAAWRAALAYRAGENIIRPLRSTGRVVNAGNGIYTSITLDETINASGATLTLSSQNLYNVGGGYAAMGSGGITVSSISGNIISFIIPITQTLAAGTVFYCEGNLQIAFS